MNERNFKYLKDQLQALGFPSRIAEEVSHSLKENNSSFHVYYFNQIKEDELMYDLHFAKRSNNEYQLKEYELTYKHINVPDLNIQAISTKNLEERLKEVNSLYDRYYEGNVENSMSRQEYEQATDFIKATNNDLYNLVEAEEGKDVAKLLMYKYFPESEYEKIFQNYQEMQKLYEHNHVFHINDNMSLTAAEAYQFLKTEKNDFEEKNTVAYEILKATAAERILNVTNSFTQKTNFMNQKNFDYLKDQVKFTGFGEGLENELKEKMQKQNPEFQIKHNPKFGNDELTVSLHFKKSDQTDMYFFNRYQVSLMPEQSKDKMEQTFYINKEGSITLKEAYNLMNGRSINKDLTTKEGQMYNAWMQMDFKQADNNGNYKLKQFHQNYGYDLMTALEKHPIKELSNEQDKTRLVESLEKGNRQSVTFEQNGNQQKHFIEANPQFKTINIYDSNMQRLNSKQGQNEKQGQGEHNSAKQTFKNESQKQGDLGDSDEMPKTSNKRRKKQNQSL